MSRKNDMAVEKKEEVSIIFERCALCKQACSFHRVCTFASTKSHIFSGMGIFSRIFLNPARHLTLTYILAFHLFSRTRHVIVGKM